jgi:hypothetical protein
MSVVCFPKSFRLSLRRTGGGRRSMETKEHEGTAANGVLGPPLVGFRGRSCNLLHLQIGCHWANMRLDQGQFQPLAAER